jgi:DNA-binding NtrC family response regulator
VNSIEYLKDLTERLPIIPRNDTRVRVLLVENNCKTRKLIGSTIEYFGGYCTSVSNGKEAMDILEGGTFDVLLGHIVVSDEIGVGVLRKFQDRNPRSMIVIISGSDDNLKEYGKYLSILALPFGFFDLIKAVDVPVEVSTQ